MAQAGVAPRDFGVSKKKKVGLTTLPPENSWQLVKNGSVSPVGLLLGTFQTSRHVPVNHNYGRV